MKAEKDKFEKRYFESECGYSSSILKGRKPLQHRFWIRYLKRHKKGGRLLDVGCGKGFFLEYAEKAYETYGIDVSKYGIEQAQSKLHRAKLYVGNAEHLDFDADYFDIVTCFDVLEHLDKPELAIKECYRVLAQNGLFIVCVPNLQSIGHQWKKQQWFGYRDPTHLSLLPEEEWEQLLQRNNFRIVDRFYDGLWDSPYFGKVPAFIQHLPFKFLFTGLYPLLGILGALNFRKNGGSALFLWLSKQALII